MKDNKGLIIIGVIIAVIIATFYFGKMGIADGTDINTPKDIGITSFFADEDKTAIELADLPTMSFVTMPGKGVSGGIYFMRYDVEVTNSGSAVKDVWVSEARIENSEGKVLQTNLVSSAFSCIMNNKITLQSDESYLFSTAPGQGTCGSGVWIPTTLFEDEEQIKVIITVKTEFNLFGILRTGEKDVIADVAITSDEDGFGIGTLGLNIQGGTDGFIEECAPGETKLCPFADVAESVCYGATQRCSESGLWYGCPSSIYGSNYIGGAESFTDNWRTVCTDGLDNDCDGVYDKAMIDGTCPRGTCDGDCPSAIVTFRTNANIMGLGDTWKAYDGNDVWIAINAKDGMLQQYGVHSVKDASSVFVGNIGYGNIRTPSGENAVIISSDPNYVYMYIKNDPTQQNDYPCKLITLIKDYGPGCRVGDPTYPACRQIFPIDIPYAINQQETHSEYGSGYSSI